MQKQKTQHNRKTDELKCTALHELETTKRKAHANKLHRLKQQQAQLAEEPAEPAILNDRTSIGLALSLSISDLLTCKKLHSHKCMQFVSVVCTSDWTQ